MAKKVKLTAGDKFILSDMVGRYHVMMPDEEVVADIISRLRTPPSPEAEKALREFVTKEHHRNRAVFLKVTSGRGF